MLTVTCPFCHEKGRIPDGFIGKRIKCGKCANRFLVTPPVPKGAGAKTDKADEPAAPTLHEPVHEGIEVEGLEAVAWSTGAQSAAETRGETEQDSSAGAQGVFTESSHAEQPTGVKEYKLLTQKDKWFEGKFDLPRLEEAINHYAQRGWKVRSMTTAQVAGFSGGIKEELVVLLER
jgi:hypothetical protein